MFKRNLFNFVLAIGLLIVGAVYISKHNFNHSGPQDSIWDNISKGVENPPTPVAPENPVIGVITTYEEALKEAKRSDKKILIIFGADWCSWCKKLDKDTLKDKTVKQAISDGNQIEIHVNVDQRKDLAKKFSVRGIPAYAIVDKDEVVVRQGSGFKDPSNYVNWLLGRWGTQQTFLSWLFGR